MTHTPKKSSVTDPSPILYDLSSSCNSNTSLLQNGTSGILRLTLKENTSWYFFSWVWPFRRIPEWVPHWTCLRSLGREGAGTGPTTSSPPGWHRNPAQRSKVSSSSGWHSKPSNPRRTACNGGIGPISKNVVLSIVNACSTSLNSKESNGVLVHANFF